MDTVTEIANRRRIGRWVAHRRGRRPRCSCCCWASMQVNRSPRTDDASVWANYIEIAPEVSGRLVELPVKDNAFVKKGDLLFVIDPRPYEYALQQALSDQQALEEQIIDERRRIAAQNSAVQAAGAAVSTSKTGIQTAGSNIDAARAAVTRAQAAATAAEAQLKLAHQQPASHRAAAAEAVRHRGTGRPGQHRRPRRPGQLRRGPGRAPAGAGPARAGHASPRGGQLAGR